MSAFYEEDGMCFWCFEKAVIYWCGVPLCDKHWVKEQREMMI